VINNFNPFGGLDFNPFDFLKNNDAVNVNPWLEQFSKNPWMEKYINQLLGSNFWQRVQDQSVDNDSGAFETNEEVIIVLKLPGLQSQKNLKVNLNGSISLLIEAILTGQSRDLESGSRSVQQSSKQSNPQKVIRNIKLPAPVKAFGSKATYKNGKLEIRLPKETSNMHQSISVQFL